LLSGDSFTGTLTRESGEDVGEYLITLGDLSAGDNYSLTFIGDTLTITPRAITVKADSQSKEYGETDPELSFDIVSGSLLSGDSFTGTLTRESGEDVGEYLITLGDLRVCDNYSLTLINATLTILPREIIISAKSQTKVYGEDDPELIFEIISGTLLDGDSISGVLSREAGENVGDYLIETGSLSAGQNYSITINNSYYLTITPALLIITADDKVKMVNNPDPEYTVTYTGLVFNDDSSVVTGLVIERTPGEAIGDYDIIPSGAIAGNYTIDFVRGTLTIEPSSSIVWDNDWDRKEMSVTGISISRNPVQLGTGIVEFSVKTPTSANLKVEIYDRMGNLLFRQNVETNRLGNSGSLYWDLTNMSGRHVTSGTYLIRVVGTDTNSSQVYRYSAKLGVYR
ncbi:hypothetical protein CHISP_3717, partial [Chitinispirillum alkaliphilum]